MGVASGHLLVKHSWLWVNVCLWMNIFMEFQVLIKTYKYVHWNIGEGFADKHSNCNMETGHRKLYHLSMSKLRNPTGRSSVAAIQISTFGPRHLFLQSQYPSGGGVGGCWAGDEPTLWIQLWYTPTKLNGISQMFHNPLQSSESGLESVCLHVS